jgi:uncharacterized protein YdaU (DUF1376 family)
LNYFEHHIGDYAEATAHLSILEDGAYSRLLRKVYATERPLPVEVDRVQRLIGARTDEERAAVETVLREFFDLRNDGWHQDRCDAAIEAYQAGAPEREIKKSNEVARQQRHRAERADLFKALHEAGQFPAWNTPITEVRSMVAKLPNAPVTPVTTPATPVTAPVTEPVTACNAPGTATQSPVPTPHLPIPTTQNNGNLSSSDLRSDGADGAPKAKPKKHFGTEDDHKAVRWMFDRICEVDATAKEPNWDTWANDMRLMREQDDRTHRDACELFGWANKDSFWKTNILSPAKLREKWSQLSLKRQNPASTGSSTRAPAMTDEQLAAKNAEETAKAKALYRERYGDGGNAGGDVIDAEARVVPEWAAIEGSTA